MRTLRIKLFQYISKIAHNDPKTISEIMKEQDRETVPVDKSKDEAELLQLLQELKEDSEKALEDDETGEKGLRYYENLLSKIKPHKMPSKIDEDKAMERTAAPKGVKDKALWNKIEKSVRKHSKYKEEQIYKVVQKAYQEAGGEYSHKSK